MRIFQAGRGFSKQEGQDIVLQAKNHREKTPKMHVQPKCQTPGTGKRKLHRTDMGNPENLDSERLKIEAGKA